MRDFFGREIHVGNRVAFMEPGYRNLISGVVIRLTPQKIRVAYTQRGHEFTFLTTGRDTVIHPEDIA